MAEASINVEAAINTEDQDTNETNDTNGNEWSDREIVSNIVSIIRKIKVERSRPCYQNIHEFLNRRGAKIDMIALRRIMDGLLDSGVITNIS